MRYRPPNRRIETIQPNNFQSNLQKMPPASVPCLNPSASEPRITDKSTILESYDCVFKPESPLPMDTVCQQCGADTLAYALVRFLSPMQQNYLTDVQLASMQDHDDINIGSLSPTSISESGLCFLHRLSEGDVHFLTPNQLNKLTTEQLAYLTSSQLRGLTDAQVQSMTKNTIQQLKHDKGDSV